MSTIREADVQITAERQQLSIVEGKIKTGLASVSKRAETTLALRSLQLAFMWLGKAKGAIGIVNPYPNSKDPSNKLIEPDVDRAEAVAIKFDDEVLFCKAIRQEIGVLSKAIQNDSQILVENKNYQLCIQNAYTNIENASMWLSVVLGNIRTEGES